MKATGMLLALTAASALLTGPAQAVISLPSRPTATATPTPTTALTAAAAGASWGIAPGPTAGARAGIDHRIGPGATVTDSVRVTNLGTGPLTLRLAALDALTTRAGAFDVIDDGEANTGAGAWIRLGRTALTLPPRTSADVGVVIGVPPDAEPGDHSAGIVAIATAAPDATGLSIQRRVGTRVHLQVTGTARTALAVTDLRTTYRDPLLPGAAGTLTVEYTVRNAGTVRVGAATWVDVRGVRGVVDERATAPAIRQVLPGAAVSVVERLDVLPAGPLDVTVTARPLSAPRLDPVTAGGLRLFGAPDATVAVQQWAWPWSLTVGLLVLAVGTVAGLRLRARRRSASPPSVGARAPSDPGAAPPGPQDVVIDLTTPAREHVPARPGVDSPPEDRP